MKPGSAIINTASINADAPNPTLLAYATTKGAIQNFTAGLAQLLADKGIRANAVAPGPIWTPLIPSTMSDEAVENFGKQVPMKRPGQHAELATAYVAGRSVVELRFGCNHRGDWRQTDALKGRSPAVRGRHPRCAWPDVAVNSVGEKQESTVPESRSLGAWLRP